MVMVPEELECCGKKREAEYYGNIEKFVIHNSFLAVNVTTVMAEYFKKKYPGAKSEMMTLPIFDISDLPDRRRDFNKGKKTVIYSGGAQKWQKAGHMVEAIGKLRDEFRFVILSKDINEFQNKIDELEVNDFVELKSVPRNEIGKYYDKADFGFILRDDINVNRVACPTKLTEYLLYGIIPIVFNPHIGDFKDLGYSYISLEDFINNNVPHADGLMEMINNNYKVAEKMRSIFNSSISELLSVKNKVEDFRPEIFLTKDEIMDCGLMAELFIDAGEGFSSGQSIVKEVELNKNSLEFDLTGYEEICGLRFDPLNCRTVLKLLGIKIITADNTFIDNISYETNALCKDNNVFIYETVDPQIMIDMKDISPPKKIIFDLEYISFGSEVYKYIFDRENSVIKVKDRIIKKQKKQIEEQENRINYLEDVLNGIYNSRGWKVLNNYYKAKDFVFSSDAEEKPIVKKVFNKLLQIKNRLTNIKVFCDKIEIYSNTIDITGWALAKDGIDKVEVYLNDDFLGEADYGLCRIDVGEAYPSVEGSGNSGFHFSLVADKFEEQGERYKVLVKAVSKSGRINRIVKHIDKSIDKYKLWIDEKEPSSKDLEKQRNKTFAFEPKISIVTPVYNTKEEFLVDMIESVINQTYSNWELCIADGGSKEGYIKEKLLYYSKKDERIKVEILSENRGISGNSAKALSLASGDFVTLLDHDDMLPPFSLYEVVKVINENPDADFIYSDEDKVSEDGSRRFDPHFKPDWSPDTLRSYNYAIHLSVFKKELIDNVGGFREGYDGSQDYDLILRATEKAKEIIHIPKILYHWRTHKASTAGGPSAKMYAGDAGKKALEDHLYRLGLDGTVEDGLFLSSYRVHYDMIDCPKVSIIIANKDYADDLRKCINSIIKKSSYKNFEIIIVENNSSERKTFELYEELKKNDSIKIINWERPFNYAAVNNYAVNYSAGDILLFLNNDMEVINSDWLEAMVEHIQRRDVGAVGAKLYYPDDTIQHGGVIIGIGGVAGHAQKYFKRNDFGYFGRLKITQNLSAVTGACLMIRKDVFSEVGGFDERYILAFNDVDLCLKIRQKGYFIIWTPYAELYHYESKTRGFEDNVEKQKRFKEEIDLCLEIWSNFLEKGDPYYNPNLTLEKEDFSIRI